MVFPDVEWLEQVCRDAASRRQIDVIPFHAYPETWTPPDVTVEDYLGPMFASGFITAADQSCGPKRVWINETGYATTPGRRELDQARWWIRAVATFLAEPRVDHLGIYEIKDLPPDRAAIGDAPNYHLGITRTNRERKLAFGTLARLVSMLGRERITVADDQLSLSVSPAQAHVYAHLFVRSDGRRVLFLWTKDSEALLTVRLGAVASRATEFSIEGEMSGVVDVIDGRMDRIALRPGEPRYFEIAP
jgi:hypothetical protein